MPLLRNIPIKRKLTLIIMLTSGVASLLAGGAFLTYEQLMFGKTMAREFSILTDVIDNNVAPGLASGDVQSISEVLKTLRAQPRVLAAAVYAKDGKIVAQYQRRDLNSRFRFPPAEKTISHFRDDRLDTFQTVTLAGEVIGTVYIAADRDEMAARLKRYGAITTLVLMISSLAAFGLSAKLQKIISEPISQLAKVAHTVAADKNYSIRATKANDDELGRLIDGFNEMLRQIQQRDSALQAAQAGLEKRVEERTCELANSLSVLYATLDSTADGILAVDLEGHVLCHNTQFAEMWHIPPEILARRNADEMTNFAASRVNDPDEFIDRIKELYESRGAESFDVLALADGRIFERYVKPQRINGQNVGMVINCRDITDRRHAEKELEKVHNQLLDTSRQAGMAEVATSVLHNVGNVLNSVNVSCSVVFEKVRKSRISNLGRAAALLHKHESDLGIFLSQDPQGRQLPSYLNELYERLVAEQRLILKEVESLHQNVEHIKEIIGMQQSYAKVCGLAEVLSITELVEDSIRMNAAALVRHGITIERQYESAPEILVEKHKVLQILVNLIRNAKYACDEGGMADKRITVKVQSGETAIRISVIDNGIGISAENLTRIFGHGFTTKRDGHGFGLHSGALAAQEMGGCLRAQSKGPGMGAEFTLELPHKTVAKHPIHESAIA